MFTLICNIYLSIRFFYFILKHTYKRYQYQILISDIVYKKYAIFFLLLHLFINVAA